MNNSHLHTHPCQPPAHVLLIEDDPHLREHLSAHFLRRGFALSASGHGSAGLEMACAQSFDLVLLDVMLPGMSGLEVLANLRRAQGVPVMLMSALGAEQDRISGFTQGADDYLPKPFSLAELDARVDALLRRVRLDRQSPPPETSASVSLQRDTAAQDVSYKGCAAGLTQSEYRLLVTLLEHPDEPLSKAFLYQHVLHRGYTRLDRGLDVHVCNLRRKLTAINFRELTIQAVRNQGYVLVRAPAD
ncbi:response regulator transcription factor [Pseudomonas sp. JDS28PS106]|uniref:response regulator transcription factor n=1 Tax=Pseudomonas sp. JDS28PS106 TaxID=2497235 RepID=UPI002FD78BD1